MGTTYSAIYHEENVAVKLYNGKDNVFFEKQIELMSLLQHQNVVNLLGASTSSDPKGYVMPFYANGSLKDVLDTRGDLLDLPTAIRVVTDVLKGLQFLHGLNIVHGNVKLENVMIFSLSCFDVVLAAVADFGITKPPTFEESVNQESTQYIAPELLGTGRSCTVKSDIYSCSMILWAGMSLKCKLQDFYPVKPEQLMVEIVKHGLRPKFAEEWTPELCAILTKTWCANPEARPSIREIISDLEMAPI